MPEPRPAANLARGLGRIGLSGVTVTAAAAAGVLTSVRAAYPRPPGLAPAEARPAPRAVPNDRLAVAVVLGASGSVITDALGPYDVFARSARFVVYTVSASQPTAMLSGGLAVVPDYSLTEVDAGTAPAPDVIVVPAVVAPTGKKEAPLRHWIAAQAGRGAHLLGVCAGARLLAATGLLDGHRATSHWSQLTRLQRRHPKVFWERGQRYVQDGKVTTTAGVTSGVFGALRLVDQLAGPAEAQRVGRELAYPGWVLDGPTAIPEQHWTPRDLAYPLAAAFPWRRPTIGVGLLDGAGELDIAAPFELYASSFAARTVPFAARTVPIAANRTITTRTTAQVTATSIEYPADRLRLAGAPWPWRPTALLALTLSTGIGVSLLPAAVTRRSRR